MPPLQTASATPSRDQRGLQRHTYGVLKLTLHASTYDWVFLPIAGSTFTDSGTGTVHGAPVTVPGAPTIGTATAGNASATVTWTAPASNGGSAITGYVVTPYIGGVEQGTTTVGDVTSTTITGSRTAPLTPSGWPRSTAVGTGAQSADSNAVTPVAPATVPGAPTIGTATAGNASATVNLDGPCLERRRAITGYVVTRYIGGDAQGTTTVGNVTSTTDQRAHERHHLHLPGGRHQLRRHRRAVGRTPIAVTPVAPNSAPSAPTLNAPTNASSGVNTSPTLDVGVSDPTPTR